MVPGKIKIKPIIENYPGNICITPKSTIKLAKKGYKVMAIAGIIGSGNILDTIKTEINWPKSRTIAIYMNEVK